MFLKRTYAECVQGLPPAGEVTGEPGESVLPTHFKTFRYSEVNRNSTSSPTTTQQSPRKKKPKKKFAYRLKNFQDDFPDLFQANDADVSNCMDFNHLCLFLSL